MANFKASEGGGNIFSCSQTVAEAAREMIGTIGYEHLEPGITSIIAARAGVYEGLRLDSQTSGQYNLQIQLGAQSHAGVFVAGEAAELASLGGREIQDELGNTMRSEFNESLTNKELRKVTLTEAGESRLKTLREQKEKKAAQALAKKIKTNVARTKKKG